MSAFRALGALLCIASVVIVVLHVGYGYGLIPELMGTGAMGTPPLGWAFALPITAGVLVACGLGFWLGWIMATTREAAPTPEPTPTAPIEEELGEELIDTLTSIDGVTRERAQAVIDLGFTDRESIRRASVEELTEAKGIGPKLAEKIKRKASR